MNRRDDEHEVWIGSGKDSTQQEHRNTLQIEHRGVDGSSKPPYLWCYRNYCGCSETLTFHWRAGHGEEGPHISSSLVARDQTILGEGLTRGLRDKEEGADLHNQSDGKVCCLLVVLCDEGQSRVLLVKSRHKWECEV
jgi:hypothetical protein